MSIFNTYLDAPSSRIQSCKETIFCQDTCSTKSIQQSTLSCICVTNLEDPTKIPTERMGIRPTNSQLRRQIALATYIIPILYRLTRSFTSLSFLSRFILCKVMTLNPKLFEKEIWLWEFVIYQRHNRDWDRSTAVPILLPVTTYWLELSFKLRNLDKENKSNKGTQ